MCSVLTTSERTFFYFNRALSRPDDEEPKVLSNKTSLTNSRPASCRWRHGRRLFAVAKRDTAEMFSEEVPSGTVNLDLPFRGRWLVQNRSEPPDIFVGFGRPIPYMLRAGV